MNINPWTFFFCLLIPVSIAQADCNTHVNRNSVPAFIKQDKIDDYLDKEKQRRNALCSQDKSISHDKGIYVQDNRLDIYQAKDTIREAARSTAALIQTQHLTREGDYYVINRARTLASVGWCDHEPFARQPVAASCTAFLVEDNTLVTAGHCLRSGSDKIPLKNYYVVFGYEMSDKNQPQTRFPDRDVYQMIEEREVKKDLDEDWAVVTLDRPVLGRRIFKFQSGEIEKGTALTIFGYPNGLPLKIAGGGEVKLNNKGETVFVTDLDSYRGNSGSPVLNTQALNRGELLVEGILVSGAADYDYSQGCKSSVTCESTQLSNRTGRCSGEKVTKINRVLTMGGSIDSARNNQNDALNTLPGDFRKLLP